MIDFLSSEGNNNFIIISNTDHKLSPLGVGLSKTNKNYSLPLFGKYPSLFLASCETLLLSPSPCG